tara:strand:- start:46 stop:294 length:249 start_codon:yes stop_codon:yes gene_type:complete
MRTKKLESKGNNKCCFCSADVGQYGNNPEPLVSYEDGKCCSKCNIELILPYRLLAHRDYDKYVEVVNELIEKGILKSKKIKL